MASGQQRLDSDILTRLALGTGAQAFSQIVLILIRLGEVPLLLAFWGTQLYGEWLVLSAIPAYLAIGDGGFAAAACREMTMRSGAGNRAGVLAVFQSTWVLLVAVSLAVIFLALGFLKAAPLEGWLGFSSMDDSAIKAVLLLLLAHVLIGFQGGLLNGAFWVTGRYPRGMYLQAVTQLLEFAGLAVAVIFGGGPVEAASAFLGGRFVGTVLVWIGQRRTSPWLQHGFAAASMKEVRQLIAPAFASLAFPLGNALNIQGMRLVVGLTLGPAAVTLFVPLRTLSNLVLQPQAVVYRLIQPELALAFGSNDKGLFRSLVANSCQFALWGCLIASSVIVPAAAWVFPAWTGGKVTMNWPVFLLLVASVLLLSIWGTALMAPYATNRHGRLAVLYALVYGVAVLPLGYFAANTWGLQGVALALLAAEAAMTIVVLRASLRLAEISLVRWANIVFRPPVRTCISIVAAAGKRIVPTTAD